MADLCHESSDGSSVVGGMSHSVRLPSSAVDPQVEHEKSSTDIIAHLIKLVHMWQMFDASTILAVILHRQNLY